VDHPGGAWGRRLTGGWGLRHRLVGALETEVAWELWKERNARFFRNEAATNAQFIAKIKQIADLWIEAGARHLGELVRE
jgi:hypothetical protein